MKTTRNRKVKRGKTRRTRRKTRTVHRGGVKWWRPWKKDNAVAPEPTITLQEVQKFLSDKSLLTTLECLTKELENRKISPRPEIHLCDAPCHSNQQPVADIIQSQTPDSLSTKPPIEPPNVWTEANRNPNGWYIKDEHNYNEPAITLIRNDNLKNMSGGPGNINNYSNANFNNYMNTINDLPDPLHSYSTDIDGVSHTFSLKSNDGGGQLLWVDSKNQRITYDYNTANPLTIIIAGKKYTLTKVE